MTNHDDQQKEFFEVISVAINREDLKDFDVQNPERLTDEQMEEIAERTSDMLGGDIHEALQVAVDDVI